MPPLLNPKRGRSTSSDQQIETPEDTAVEDQLEATHSEGAALTFALDSEPSHGVATITDSATGAYRYEPAPDFAGEDSFTVRVEDENGNSAVASIMVTVQAENDPPRIELPAELAVTVGEEVDMAIAVDDPEGDAYTVTVDSLPPDLAWVDGRIAGAVAPAAADGSPVSHPGDSRRCPRQ